AGVVKGKQGYMSPEQCRGDTVDRTSDVFGLGILLWELTVGKRLFTGDNDYAVMSKIVFGMVPDPRELVPGYPPRLAEIVMRALQRDPAARQRSALQLALELEAFAHGEHIQISGNALADLMQQSFGDHPYPTPGRAREPEVDEDAATRIAMVEPTRTAPPSRTVVAAAVSVPVLVIGLAAAWMFVRPNAVAHDDVVDALPSPEVATPSEPAVAAIEAAPVEAVPVEAPPITDDEPELIEGASPTTPSSTKAKRPRDDRSRPRASSEPTPVSSSPKRPDGPRAPIPSRKNELFPPDEGPRSE
ncbi:MAG TPA: protein kinase, partial [Nannocystaceae bacterium]|nr:protein kinase [Nannocystaceae bacterium]